MQPFRGALEQAVTVTILTMTLSLVWGGILPLVITLGEMYEPEEAFSRSQVAPEMVDTTLEETIAGSLASHKPSHATAKRRLRQPAMDAMRMAIDRELTMAAYEASNRARSAIAMPRQAASPTEKTRPIWHNFVEPCRAVS
ncbi:hypothetical protein [Bradyrhizobium sp. 5.13L]